MTRSLVGKFFLFTCLSLSTATSAMAGAIELSGMISYGRSNLGDGASSRQNRYTAEVAWRFTKVSAFELAYSTSRTKITQPVNLNSVIFTTVNQTTIYDDEVYSASWVQNLVPSSFIIQPYAKLGGGRLIRKQRAEYSALFAAQELTQKSVTGVAGLGLRIFLTRNMALKGEFVTYVPKFRFKEWQDSQNFSGGLSWMF